MLIPHFFFTLYNKGIVMNYVSTKRIASALAAFVLFALVLGTVSSCTTATDPNAVSYSISLAGENQPTPVAGAGSGTFTADYNKSTRVLKYTLTWTLTGGETATAAHFHGPAAAGVNAGVAVNIFTSANTTGKVESTSVTLTEAQAADMLAGKWYINIHTAKNPSGALRGQFPAK